MSIGLLAHGVRPTDVINKQRVSEEEAPVAATATRICHGCADDFDCVSPESQETRPYNLALQTASPLPYNPLDQIAPN